MKRLILLILLVFLTFVSNAIIPTKYYNVEVFSVEDKKLEPILDSVLAIEKTRHYYNSDKKFMIWFRLDSVIQITAYSCLVALDGYPNPTGDLGVFEYKGHLFFVHGTYYDRRIFRPTGQKKRCLYYTKMGIVDDKGMFHTLPFDDGGYNVWEYKYTADGFFELVDFLDTSKPIRP